MRTIPWRNRKEQTNATHLVEILIDVHVPGEGEAVVDLDHRSRGHVVLEALEVNRQDGGELEETDTFLRVLSSMLFSRVIPIDTRRERQNAFTKERENPEKTYFTKQLSKKGARVRTEKDTEKTYDERELEGVRYTEKSVGHGEAAWEGAYVHVCNTTAASCPDEREKEWIRDTNMRCRNNEFIHS